MAGRLSAVLFDMDGTLLDSEKLWAVGLRDLCARLGFVMDETLRASLIGMDHMQSMRRLHAMLGIGPDGVDDSADWLLKRMSELFSEGVVWQPGAQELVRQVRDAGYATALVTATKRVLVDVIVTTIDPGQFDVSVCGDEVERNKPDPMPYVHAMRLLDVPASECIAIEDSRTGVDSAVAAGCSVLAVPSEVDIDAGDGVTVMSDLISVDVHALRAIHGRWHNTGRSI